MQTVSLKHLAVVGAALAMFAVAVAGAESSLNAQQNETSVLCRLFPRAPACAAQTRERPATMPERIDYSIGMPAFTRDNAPWLQGGERRPAAPQQPAPSQPAGMDPAPTRPAVHSPPPAECPTLARSGDGLCSPDETAETGVVGKIYSPDDCHNDGNGGEGNDGGQCGDGTCQDGELQTCPQDCLVADPVVYVRDPDGQCQIHMGTCNGRDRCFTSQQECERSRPSREERMIRPDRHGRCLAFYCLRDMDATAYGLTYSSGYVNLTRPDQVEIGAPFAPNPAFTVVSGPYASEATGVQAMRSECNIPPDDVDPLCFE